MEYTKLGNSDFRVSRICLGCMGFGEPDDRHPWAISEEESEKIIARALELGVNFFDTAMTYNHGTSEEFLGRIIKRLAKREDVVIATKFHPRSAEEIEAGIGGKQHVLDCLDASLKRLGMDYVDLYIYHVWDFNTPIEEILEGLNEAVRSGRTRAIGISNCFAWQLVKANDIAERNGWAKFVSVQGHHNLIFREEEREMDPCCRDGNIASTPYSPLASGRLAKNKGETSKRLETDDIAKSKYDSTREQDEIIIDRVHEIAEKHGWTNTQVSLGWLLTRTTAPVIGATKIKHIEEAVKAFDISLSPEEIQYLEEPYVPHKLVGVMSWYKN